MFATSGYWHHIVIDAFSGAEDRTRLIQFGGRLEEWSPERALRAYQAAADADALVDFGERAMRNGHASAALQAYTAAGAAENLRRRD